MLEFALPARDSDVDKTELGAKPTFRWQAICRSISIECSLAAFHSTTVDTSSLEMGSAIVKGPLGVGPGGPGLYSLEMFLLFTSRMGSG